MVSPIVGLKADAPIIRRGGKTVHFSADWGVLEVGFFVILDSQHPSSAQTEWLDLMLQTPEARNATWRFAIFHHPVYPCNSKSPFDKGIAWIELFEQHGVDMVFVAHSHTYERSCPMIGGRCQEGGVIYLNSSGAGASTRSTDPTKVDTASYGGRSDTYDCSEILQASFASWHHFCHLIIEGERLDVACYSHDDTSVAYDVIT